MEENQKAQQLFVRNLPEIMAGDTDYLGDPAVVEAIVRNFLADAIKARSDFLNGVEGAEDPAEWLAQRAAAEADKLLGKSNALLAVPDWNTPDGGLIGNVRRRYDLTPAEPEVILAVPFYKLVEEYLFAEEQAAKGNDWQHLIEGGIELVVAVLMGTDEFLFPFEPETS